jgi:hypothetical protein
MTTPAASSIQILKTIAQARLRADATGLADSPDLRAALADAFENPPEIAASEGDVARASLDLLAEDPDHEPQRRHGHVRFRQAVH